MNVAENSPRTEWEERAIEIYNGGEDYSPDRNLWTTPYDFVLYIFKLIAVSRWIQNMRSVLPNEDFDELARYIKREIQAKKKTSLPYTSLYDIIEKLNNT
jgi:hypothetical protein